MLAAMAAAGCRSQPSAEGSFDKTLNVSGPIRNRTDQWQRRFPASASDRRAKWRVHGEIQFDRGRIRAGSGAWMTFNPALQ